MITKVKGRTLLYEVSPLAVFLLFLVVLAVLTVLRLLAVLRVLRVAVLLRVGTVLVVLAILVVLIIAHIVTSLDGSDNSVPLILLNMCVVNLFRYGGILWGAFRRTF